MLDVFEVGLLSFCLALKGLFLDAIGVFDAELPLIPRRRESISFSHKEIPDINFSSLRSSVLISSYNLNYYSSSTCLLSALLYSTSIYALSKYSSMFPIFFTFYFDFSSWICMLAFLSSFWLENEGVVFEEFF